MNLDPFQPQIKICGLTVPEQAAACAQMGADAIGLVFYPPSPRHLAMDRAAEVAAAVSDRACCVGVFVDPAWDLLAEAVERCRLGAVQLHGNESPALVARVQQDLSVKVIKGLFAAKPPRLADAGRYPAAAYLVECGRGAQPGGNALTWNWAEAEALARRCPILLAGGLTPDNVAEAIAAARPAAVDASSGLEASPGCKDVRKVERFIAVVRRTACQHANRGTHMPAIF